MEHKDFVINTSAVNSYGSRVITAGIDIQQYQKNSVLLYMHDRSNMPIGRVDNIRIDGDRMIGTPVFDDKDEFAKKIADKWDGGFLNMASAGIEILETSVDPVDLLQGQTRATIIKSKLIEVSIVDIGANDEALKLYQTGCLLKLSAGQPCDVLPLVKNEEENNAEEAKLNLNKQNNMSKELLLFLGLPETATDEQVLNSVKELKASADKVGQLQLANITAAVETAIAEKRITADKKDHFINLGKIAGYDSLKETISLMQPVKKPTDVIDPSTGSTPQQGEPKTFAKLSEVPADNLMDLRDKNPKEYARLYKAEYGMECPKI